MAARSLTCGARSYAPINLCRKTGAWAMARAQLILRVDGTRSEATPPQNEEPTRRGRAPHPPAVAALEAVVPNAFRRIVPASCSILVRKLPSSRLLAKVMSAEASKLEGSACGFVPQKLDSSSRSVASGALATIRDTTAAAASSALPPGGPGGPTTLAATGPGELTTLAANSALPPGGSGGPTTLSTASPLPPGGPGGPTTLSTVSSLPPGGPGGPTTLATVSLLPPGGPGGPTTLATGILLS
jgi:hypothetical protein